MGNNNESMQNDRNILNGINESDGNIHDNIIHHNNDVIIGESRIILENNDNNNENIQRNNELIINENHMMMNDIYEHKPDFNGFIIKVLINTVLVQIFMLLLMAFFIWEMSYIIVIGYLILLDVIAMKLSIKKMKNLMYFSSYFK